MEQKSNIWGVAKKHGIILGLISITYFVILNIAGLVTNQIAGYVGYIFSIAIIYMAHGAFKNEGDGYMTYGQGLGLGTATSLISGVISSVFSFIYIKFIDDSFLEQIMDKAVEDMEAKGMSDGEIDQAMEITSMMMNPIGITIMGIIGAVFLGFVFSLVISAITKNTNPELEI